MKCCYVASPYRLPHGGQAMNVHRQMFAAHRLLDMGISPIAPLLNHFLDVLQPREEDDWIEADLELVRRVDAVLRLGGESVGADREVALAKELGIPVFFTWAQLEEWLWVETHDVDTSGMDVRPVVVD